MEISTSNLYPESSLTPQVTALSGCELLIAGAPLSSVPFIESKLGHNLQTSFNNNANSLVQDPSNLFHQLNRRMPQGLESGSGWGWWGVLVGAGGKQQCAFAGLMWLPGGFVVPSVNL